MKNLSYLLFAASLGSSAVASANAFNINEHDAKTTGRGGASAATNTTPSAVVFNPGGVAVEEGTNVEVSGSVIAAQGSYELQGTSTTVTTDQPTAFVPSGFITTRINKMFAAGLGVSFPFGLSISWPQGHPQAEVAQDSTLRTYFFTGVVGVNLDDYVPGLSVGGGIDVVPATIELERAIVFGDTRGRVKLGGKAFGLGGRAGVMYRPPSLAQLKFGVMYRSQVTLPFGGQADFDIADPFRQQLPPDGDVKATLRLPQQVWGGIAYDPRPDIEVELNAVWMDWSTFKEIRIELPAGAETVSPQDYHDTLTWRVGVQYEARKDLQFRAGFIFDPTPIPTTTQTALLPDVDRKIITLGSSKYFGTWAAHLAFLWVTPDSRETSDKMFMPIFKGTYSIQAFVGSVTLSAHL